MRAPEHVGSVEAYGILVPQPEIKLTFPELEGGFFTTGPPGKSPLITLKNRFLKIFYVHDFLGFARKQFTPNLSWIWQQTFYHLSHFLWFGNLESAQVGSFGSEFQMVARAERAWGLKPGRLRWTSLSSQTVSEPFCMILLCGLFELSLLHNILRTIRLFTRWLKASRTSTIVSKAEAISPYVSYSLQSFKASLSQYSIGHESHKRPSNFKRRRHRGHLLIGKVSKSHYKKSIWDGRYLWNHLWKIQSAIIIIPSANIDNFIFCF